MNIVLFLLHCSILHSHYLYNNKYLHMHKNISPVISLCLPLNIFHQYLNFTTIAFELKRREIDCSNSVGGTNPGDCNRRNRGRHGVS